MNYNQIATRSEIRTQNYYENGSLDSDTDMLRNNKKKQTKGNRTNKLLK